MRSTIGSLFGIHAIFILHVWVEKADNFACGIFCATCAGFYGRCLTLVVCSVTQVAPCGLISTGLRISVFTIAVHKLLNFPAEIFEVLYQKFSCSWDRTIKVVLIDLSSSSSIQCIWYLSWHMLRKLSEPVACRWISLTRLWVPTSLGHKLKTSEISE